MSEAISYLGIITEKYMEVEKDTYVYFIDSTETFLQNKT